MNGQAAGGYAFVALYRGREAASGVWGWARRLGERQSPSVRRTLQTPIDIASSSKTVTAVSLLHLWDETHHSFSLDDPFWPHIRNMAPRVSEDAKKITIRQVLQPRSGLPAIGGANSPRTLEALLQKPMAYPAGSRSHYDNRNYYITRVLSKPCPTGITLGT